jgi:prepilin-type N-terminal cleavage/methylation domain-containing protein
MKAAGFSLVELMVTLLLSSLISLACVEWFVSLSRLYRNQSLLIEANEVGRFTLTYLTKSLAKAGAGLDSSQPKLIFNGSDIGVRYASTLLNVGVIRNCLGNKSKGAVIEDLIGVEQYALGGKELKCRSAGRADWLTEGIEGLEFQVAVDQGAFIGSTFITGQFDGIPDAYLDVNAFQADTMKVLAVRIFVSAYRPGSVSKLSPKYWALEETGERIQANFATLVLLPNS